jgi:hypothetical protein
MPSPILKRGEIIMKIAKRTLKVTGEELAELFGLPEEVEVMAIRKSGEDEFEFLLASAGEVFVGGKKITHERKDGEPGLSRMISLSTLKQASSIQIGLDMGMDIESATTVSDALRGIKANLEKGMDNDGSKK